MKYTAPFIAVIVALAIPALANDSVPGGITEVSVRYSSGWIGRMYSVWLKADGTAIFRGDRRVPRLGTFQSQFPKGEFAKLAAYLVEIGYASLDKDQNRRGTDGSSFLITIKPTNGKPKEILLHNPEDLTAPPKLWAIKHIVDSLTSDLPWEDYSDSPSDMKPTDPTEIIIPEFKLPAQPPGRVSLQRVAEHAWLCSHEFDAHAQGVNIVLDVSESKRTSETIAIDMTNQSVAHILNHVASLEGLTLTHKGRTIVIREKPGSL